VSVTLPFELDLHQLAGLSRILEIRLGECELHVTELSVGPLLRKKGGSERKEWWSDRITLPSNASIETEGEALAELLKDKTAKARRARIVLRTQAVRTLRADLPEGDIRIPEWIEDHAETLLQLPVTTGSMAFDFRHLGTVEGTTTIEIAFARASEIDKALAVCRAAGLNIESISAACESEPHASPFEFLKGKPCEEAETHLWQSLFQRAALASGMVVLVLLLLQFGFAMYVESRTAEATESSLEIEASARDVAARDAQVRSLEEQLMSVRAGAHRSQLSRSLHDLASSVTPGVRFHELDVTSPVSGAQVFTVKGSAGAHAHLAAWLAALDSVHFARGARLVRSGKPEELSSNQSDIPRSGGIGFEVRGELSR
jgi:Tfp pilus assembly protein PilN